MSEAKADDGLISVFIDDQEVRTEPGKNIIEVAASIGVEIPHYCYHPKLSVSGNCRMCLVELGMPGRDRATGEPILNEDGTPKIQFFPGPAIACNTKAAPGMHIRTGTDMVKQCREGVMEFLLINHPLDCPICDQAGECRLQEFAADYGTGYSRFVENKVVKPKRTVLGPRVMLDDERCVLCSRCVRFSKEIAKDPVLGFIDRGSYSTLTCYPGKQLENNYSLNTVDICPVGALTSRDFRFKMRVWFLKETPSICTESSVGVNTMVASREGKLYRITPRRNDEVNDTWMSDSGRALYKTVEEGRLSEGKGSVDEAVAAMKSGKVALVGSGRSSVEEQFLYKKLADAVGAVSTYIVGRAGEGDELLISADRNPNVRGALITGLISDYPANELTALAAQIDSGAVDTVVAYNEDLIEAGLSEAQLAKVKVVYIGSHSNATSAAAAVALPTLTVFEKYGTFINQEFRIQKFLPAIPGLAGAKDDLVVLSALLAGNDVVIPAKTATDVWTALSEEVALLKDLSFTSIAPTGVLLDGSAYQHLPFVEGKTLHFEPASETAEKAGA